MKVRGSRAIEWIRRRLSDEQGIVLVLALGIPVVLGISGATLMQYTATNALQTGRSHADLTAFQFAEAGVGGPRSSVRSL